MDISEQQQLAKSIHTALSSISSGLLDNTEAENVLQNLEKQYRTLKQKTAKTDGRNSLEGLCCNHNSDNCAIFTGIIISSQTQQTVISSFGSIDLSEKIFKVCRESIDNFENRMYMIISPEKSGILKNTLHIYPFRKIGHSFYALVSLSSSALFDSEIFIHFGNFVDLLFPTGKDHPCGVIDTFHSIRDYIEQNAGQYSLHAQIYHFHDLDRIFSHAGIHTLFDVSEHIEKQMVEMWGRSIPRFTISVKEYIVIVPRDKSHDPQYLTGDFYYKDIPIPFVSKNISLDHDGGFYSLIDALFTIIPDA